MLKFILITVAFAGLLAHCKCSSIEVLSKFFTLCLQFGLILAAAALKCYVCMSLQDGNCDGKNEKLMDIKVFL